MASKNFNKLGVFLPCYLTNEVHPYFNLPVVVHDCCTVFGSLASVFDYYRDLYPVYEPLHDTCQRCVYCDHDVDFVPLFRGKSTGITYGYIILNFND